MKKLSILFFFSIIQLFSNAQTFDFTCGTEPDSVPPIVYGTPPPNAPSPPGGNTKWQAWRGCSGQSLSPWVDEINNWLPKMTDPIKEVRMNLIIVQRDDSTGNFLENDSAHNAYLDAIEDKMNERLENNIKDLSCDTSSSTFCYTDDFLPDTRIRLKFNRIYIRDTYYWNNENNQPFEPRDQFGQIISITKCPGSPGGWWLSPLASQVYQDDGDTPGINVFITQGDSNLRLVDSCYASPPNFSTWCSQSGGGKFTIRDARMSVTDMFSRYEWRRKCWVNDPTRNTGNLSWEDLTDWMAGGAAKGILHELLHQFFFGEGHCKECNANVMTKSGFGSREYLSNDNIANMHKSLSTTFLTQMVVRKPSPDNGLATGNPSNYQFIEIDSATLWDIPMLVDRDIVIRSGALLNLGCTLYMPENGRIIVEPGARLYLSKAHITNYDDKYWEGIELWGNSDENQFPLDSPSYQAKLVTTNDGSTIQNAKYAIKVYKPGDWSSHGGLIEAEDVTFINTRRAVEFLKYDSLNHSYFKNCTFINDTNFTDKDTSVALPFVTMWATKGIRFEGCKFTDLTSINEYAYNKGNGIFSIDAGYTVTSFCASTTVPCPTNDIIRSEFNNFNHGVYALGEGSANTITVEEADIIDNAIGLRADETHNVRFTENYFIYGDTLKTNYPITLPYHSGIYAYKSTGFEIEGNELIGSATALAQTNGITVIDAGGGHNEVYRNIFRKNDIAQLYEGNNRSKKFKGLVFLCNTNPVSNTKDVVVDNILVGSQGLREGIRNVQNSNTFKGAGAGNTFSSSTSSHLENSSSQPIDYHSIYSKRPTVFTAGLVDTTIVSINQACASKLKSLNSFGSTQITPTEISNYYNELKEYKDLLYTYYQNIDNGNTDSLLDAINLNFSSQAQQMRDNLMAQAPYLSTSALMNAANTGTLTDALLLEVCLANPDATQSEGFLDYVEYQIPNPLPSSMVQLIYQSWGSVTTRTLLEWELAFYDGSLGHQSNQILHHYQTDTLDHYDSIMSILESRNTLESDYRRIEIAMDRNNYTTTSAIFSEIEQYHTFSTAEAAEHNNFKDFVSFNQSLYNQSKVLMNLNATDLNSLRIIANKNTGRSSTMAHNILCFGYDECPTTSQSQNRLKSRSSRVYDMTPPSNQAKSFHPVTLSPNPANENVVININGLASGESALLSVQSIGGQEMLQKRLTKSSTILSVKDLSKGVYLYQVVKGKKQIDHGKLIIQ